jgi:hypothetical protein
MIEETSFACSSCEYPEVCSDVRRLVALRESLVEKKQMGGD